MGSHTLAADSCYFFRRGGRGRCVQLSSGQQEPRSRGPRLSPGPSGERQTGRVTSWERCGGHGCHGSWREGGAPSPERVPRPGKRDAAGKGSPEVVSSSLGSFREERSEKARKSHHRITSVFRMGVMGTQAGTLSVTVGRMGQLAVTDRMWGDGEGEVSPALQARTRKRGKRRGQWARRVDVGSERCCVFSPLGRPRGNGERVVRGV